MKILKKIKYFFIINVLFSQVNVYDSILHNSLQRTYLLHIPPSYSSVTPTPLVIGLHGGGSPSWLALEQTSKLISKSNAGGFLLVYPEGRKIGLVRTWNGGGCCNPAVNLNVDDVGFISALLDTLIAQYNVDTNRIYVTGISNGAIMAYRLACELSHRIAAIAPVAGTLEDTLFVCNPTRPVPIIQFHSVLDSNIYLKGGVGQGVSGYSFNSVNYGLQKFSSFNMCSLGPDSTYHIMGNSYYYKKRWYSCPCNAELILYVTGDGGHSWPGGDTGSYAGADPPSYLIHANDSMWNFFQQHPLNCGISGISKNESPILKVSVYPNPFSHISILKFNREIHNGSLNITNALGEQVRFIQNINNNTFILDRGTLSEGIYYLKLYEKNKILFTSKICILP